MVLINGVKYACERCIRGHRVTTCTHTEQPLMMIKPKGRPSTQCPHCKEVRRIKNSHVKCACTKRPNGRGAVQHNPDCPCYVTGECTCCTKKKTKKPGAASAGKKISGGSSDGRQARTINGIEPAITSNEENLLLSTPMSLPSASNISSMAANEPVTASSWELPNGTNGLLAKDTPSGISQQQNLNNLLPSRKASRDIGMDPLDNIKPVPMNLRQKRVGEITIPMNEYVAPMNSMNNHFNALLSNIGDFSSPCSQSPGASNKGISPENYGQSLHNDSTGFISDLYDIPTQSTGGLLDFLDDDNNNAKSVTTTNNNQINSSSNTPVAAENPLDSYFPLHPLIGLSHTMNNQLVSNNTGSSVQSQGSSRLSAINLSKLNIDNQSQTSLLQQATQNQLLSKNQTGSSTSSHSYHHFHHSGSHTHLNHSNHYQPYTKRSGSFLSISSGNSVGSSANGSPSAWDIAPQMLTSESVGSIQPFIGGPNLTTSKTNTTLMDDIYQTKTYTESQNGDARSRKSISHHTPQDWFNEFNINNTTTTSTNNNNNIDDIDPSTLDSLLNN